MPPSASTRRATRSAFSPAPRRWRRSNAAIATTSIGALVFAIAAGVATVVAVGQAISRHLGRSQPDQAVLSALGLPRRDRAGALALELVPVAAAAALLAAAVAVLASVFTPFGAARRFEPEPGVHVDVTVLLVGTAVVVAVVALLGAHPGLAGNAVGERPSRTTTDGGGHVRRAGGRRTDVDDRRAACVRARPRASNRAVAFGCDGRRARCRRRHRRSVRTRRASTGWSPNRFAGAGHGI